MRRRSVSSPTFQTRPGPFCAAFVRLIRRFPAASDSLARRRRYVSVHRRVGTMPKKLYIITVSDRGHRMVSPCRLLIVLFIYYF
ncbi:hypothetical protein Csal_1646 [Chromohalobacter israelensis DSM 3043]|uniref:Uncharacterized protein n=1 Tax=Chromohalobacter israelensis (strain ATCC BAA-138 / DSM 3043 / CIP 106854 / NCIMB 13768 / 1H11) TaxID=290398 RepID=Q1QX09_CHRI1|nr:hypothetical protein Csal_1646 [Chromohalobacter salexigens DSM 3043]